jgi:hypothetical protein
MAFANDPTFIDGLTYSALEVRLADAMMLQANGNAGGATSGIRPGDTGLAVSLVGTTITVTAGVAALFYPAFGLYRACSSSSTTLTLSAADPTNPRVDLVYLRVWDNAVDGAGLSKADTVYLAGTPAVSPVAPTPAGSIIYIPLATISVPKVGGGAASVSSAVRPVTVAPGGISPSASAAGLYAGQYRDTGVTAGVIQRFNGTAWEDALRLNVGGKVDVGASGIGGAFVAQTTNATDPFITSQKVGDAVAEFSATSAGTFTWGSGAATRDTNLYRSGVGTLTTDGNLTVGGIGQMRFAQKSADTTRASNTTIAADPDLVFATVGPGTYVFDGMIWYSGQTTASGPGDLKCDFFHTGTTSATIWSGSGAPNNTQAGLDTFARAFGTATSFGTFGTGLANVLPVRGAFTVSVSGTFQFRWAENTSAAVGTLVRASSWLRLHRIA